MSDIPSHSGPAEIAGKASATVAAMRHVRDLRLADWLSLAAAPTFLAMTVATAMGGGAPMMCSDGQGAFPLTGMAMMYLLMSAFHLTPWMRLASRAKTPG